MSAVMIETVEREELSLEHASHRARRNPASDRPVLSVRTWLWFFGLDRIVALVAGWVAE